MPSETTQERLATPAPELGAGPTEPQTVDPVSAPDWDAALARHTEATVFHGRGWAQTLTSTYRHRPCYLGLPNATGAGALLPLMEVDSWLTGRKGVSLPFTDACPPLASNDQFRLLFRRGLELGQEKGWKYLELRGVQTRQLGLEPSLSFLGHRLDLARDEERILGGFESSMRRAIRKAEKAGLAVSVGAAPEDVRAYYDLHCLTRQRHGLPPQPYRFFANLQRFVLAAGHGFVVIARAQERPVAAAVFLHFGRQAVYKYGATDLRCQELRASNLVMWRGIQTCRQRGCHTLDFGRTSRDDEGLRRFKLGFGAEEQTVDYLRFDLRRRVAVTVRDRAQGRMNNLFRHVPRPAARWLGTLLYPHIS